MKKNFIALFLMAFVGSAIGQVSSTLNIIPEPVLIEKVKGDFIVPDKITLLRPAGVENDITVNFLLNKISTATGKSVIPIKKGKATIKLILNSKVNETIGDEGYTLNVTPQNITISANKPAGLYYGVQTLIQLFPAQIESKNPVAAASWKIPAVNITDYPRLKWRGLMLDVSRHFFTKNEVEQFIDQMSRYKYNIFHWHLTDDEGWRIEIKSLPKLTEVGAWRVEKIGNFGTFSNPLPDEPKNYGGFYTQDDIREIVKYAQDRFVQIMPEIDVPGHSMAAIASYPELSSADDANTYDVRAGEPIIDWTTKPHHTAMKDNNLSPAKEEVYVFLDKVIGEIAALFPFQYIHTGGDETTYNFWENNPEIQALMEKEGIKTVADVQTYFENRLEKIVQSKGKKMMGWDEILAGGISPSTDLMSWRGLSYGIDASNKGHKVVMAPMQYVYFDYMQGDISTEAPVYSSLRLNQVYKFSPIPKEANASNILGAQANIWTEQIYNFRQLQYMLWPRGFALAETVWSPEDKKDWTQFIRKTEDHFKRLDYDKIKYSKAIYDPIISVSKSNDKYYVALTMEVEGLDIYTSFDNSTPDNFYPKYTTPLEVPKDAKLMRIITYKGEKPIGRLMTISVDDLKKRVK